jgi:hypothetical protein
VCAWQGVGFGGGEDDKGAGESLVGPLQTRGYPLEPSPLEPTLMNQMIDLRHTSLCVAFMHLNSIYICGSSNFRCPQVAAHGRGREDVPGARLGVAPPARHAPPGVRPGHHFFFFIALEPRVG